MNLIIKNILNIRLVIFNMSHETIENIIEIKNMLISCEKIDGINEIMQSVDNFLLKHCLHEIIDDLIDIDPDRSKTIFYCKKCQLTFNALEKKSQQIPKSDSGEWLSWYFDEKQE